MWKIRASDLVEQALLLYARNFPFQRGKLRLINTAARLLPATHSLRTAKLVYGGFSMPVELNDMLQRQFYFFGTYFLERELLSSWSRLSREANVVFDVGANAGIYSLATLAANPSAAVNAFEPTPEIAQRLRQTAEINNLPGLRVHQIAVSDRSGTSSLIRCRGDEGYNDGMNYIQNETMPGDETVATITLDDFCASAEINYIDLMKIDIQGAEAAALRGAARLLRERCIGKLFLELNWSDDPRTCVAREALSLLEDAGFVIFDPTNLHQPLCKGDRPQRLTDVIAVNGERAILS